MREILPNQLWIGNAGDGRDPERLLAAGVVAVVDGTEGKEYDEVERIYGPISNHRQSRWYEEDP